MTTEEHALMLARADGWELDTSPATEMSNEVWYRKCPTLPAKREEELIDLYLPTP